MRDSLGEGSWKSLYPGEICQPSDLVRSVLDREIARLPRQPVSDHETRYPTDAPSMRAFLETFYTRHLFQVQNSLANHVASPDFRRTIQSGFLRILDVGSGPAVASLGLIDMIRRMKGIEVSEGTDPQNPVHMTHVLNDTSAICLATGRRILATCSPTDAEASGHRIVTLSTAFPGNLHQIRHLASHSCHFDIVILSYVMRPLVDDNGLRSLAIGLKALERVCKPEGCVLLLQDKFQEPLIRQFADMMSVQCREQTLTQELYPPRGNNERCTYTYYDCVYTPSKKAADWRWTAA